MVACGFYKVEMGIEEMFAVVLLIHLALNCTRVNARVPCSGAWIGGLRPVPVTYVPRHSELPCSR